MTTDREYQKKQEGGDHYKNFAIEPLTYCLENRLGFAEGSIVKYVSRYRLKGGKEDLLKALHYLEALMETEYPDGEGLTKRQPPC